MRRGAARRAVLVAVVCAVANAATAHAADPQAPGTTERFTIGSGDGEFPYLVYTPTSYRAGTAMPLVVMTHGCQTSAEQQQAANLHDRLAERERFIVMYPDVSAVERGQPGPLRNCWQFPFPSSWRRDAGNAGALAAMTRATMERRTVDAERVYMVGMSAGGFMTSIMAAAYPDLFAAVAINAAGAYADGTCLGVPAGLPVAVSAQLAREEMGERARVVPRIVSGGDSDQGIPPGCADKALEQGLRTNNLVLGDRQDAPLSLTPAAVREEPAQRPGGYPSTVSTYRDTQGCVVAERWLIHGMNHFWPGGSDDPKVKSFTDPKGPNGAELTWAFLKRFTKSGTAKPCVETPLPVPAPAPAATKRCAVRSLTVRVPRGAKRIRVKLNGRVITVRSRTPRTVRLRLPATTRTRTSIVLRGRTPADRPFVRRVARRGC